MGPASWDHGEQRGKLGVPLPGVVYPQLSFLREFIRDVGGRAVPGPWKLPGLTLTCCVKLPLHISLLLGSQTKHFKSEPFPAESQPILTGAH